MLYRTLIAGVAARAVARAFRRRGKGMAAKDALRRIVLPAAGALVLDRIRRRKSHIPDGHIARRDLGPNRARR